MKLPKSKKMTKESLVPKKNSHLKMEFFVQFKLCHIKGKSFCYVQLGQYEKFQSFIQTPQLLVILTECNTVQTINSIETLQFRTHLWI